MIFDADPENDICRVLRRDQDASWYPQNQHQSSQVCASVLDLAALSVNDLIDSWYLDILTWAPTWYRNCVAIDWAIHVFDAPARAAAPKGNQSRCSPLSNPRSSIIEYDSVARHAVWNLRTFHAQTIRAFFLDKKHQT